MKRARCAIVVTALVVLVAIVVAAQDDAFIVVVHESNSTTAMTTKELSRLFLKKDETWPDGTKVTAADLSPDSPVRAAFTTVVHGRKVSAIKSYWQRQIFAGKAVPPMEFTSENDVLSFVSMTPGSVAYVSASKSLRDGVKVLEVRE